MDLEKYLAKYTNVSKEELEKIVICVCSENNPDRFDINVDCHAKILHENREKEKIEGIRALVAGPIIQILSLSIQPNDQKVNQFAIYGRIGVQFPDFTYGKRLIGHDLYKRESSIPQLLDTTGTLMLNGPDSFFDPDHAYIPLLQSSLQVELFDKVGNVFACDTFSLEDEEFENDYEEVKSKFFICEQGSLMMQYIVIPYGVYCRLEVIFTNRQKSNTREFVNVNGKISSQYVNTLGNYASEEIINFDQQVHEYQHVKIGETMQLLTHWVALPAYSSIVVDLNLSEFETGRNFVKDKMKFRPQLGWLYGDSFILDDFFIEVTVAWFSTPPMGTHHQKSSHQRKKISIEEMDVDESSGDGDDDGEDGDGDDDDDDDNDDEDDEDDGDDDDDDEDDDNNEDDDDDGDDEDDDDEDDDNNDDDEDDDDDDASSDVNLTRVLRPHRSKPRPSAALEIFTIFIGRKKSKALQIYGSIDVVSYDNQICSLFKRDEKDVFDLLEYKSTLDVIDGSRAYEEYQLGIKVDLKGIDDHLDIKGYVEWEGFDLEKTYWCERQLCSFFRCRNGSGFAAVHYSIFRSAVQANIKVSLRCKLGLANVDPKVFGSLIVQYNYFDYSSFYNKERYRSVLFRRMEADFALLNADSTLPLSRSVVVVPSYAHLIINVDLDLSGEKLLCTSEIEIGEDHKTIETRGYFLYIELDWCEVK